MPRWWCCWGGLVWTPSVGSPRLSRMWWWDRCCSSFYFPYSRCYTRTKSSYSGSSWASAISCIGSRLMPGCWRVRMRHWVIGVSLFSSSLSSWWPFGGILIWPGLCLWLWSWLWFLIILIVPSTVIRTIVSVRTNVGGFVWWKWWLFVRIVEGFSFSRIRIKRVAMVATHYWVPIVRLGRYLLYCTQYYLVPVRETGDVVCIYFEK